MSSYLSSLLSSAFGGRKAVDDEGDSDFEDAAGSEENRPPADPSVHWLSVQTTQTDATVVCEKGAADHLKKIGPEVALNLVSIFGGARQGKSFLMNMLASAGDDRLFKISNSKDPCTQGVDLSRKVLTWVQFHRLDAEAKGERRSLATSSSEPRPHVAFVDVEGQGDRDQTYDANLICPIVLASKAVIFNWKDSLQKDKLLNMLGIVARAAASVAPEEDEDGDGVAVSGFNTFDLADISTSDLERVFGHLHLVFRDWTYEPSDESSVHETLFNPETSAAPDAVLRNQIRAAVTEAFESITVWLLPPPVDQVAALRKELVASDLSDEFKRQVQKLRHALAEQLKEPKRFAGKVLTGPKVAFLVPKVVATLNKGESVMPKSAYAALIEAEVARVQATYLRRLQRALEAAKAAAEQAPMATPALAARVQGEVHTLVMEFDRWLRTLGDERAAVAAAAAFHAHCEQGAGEVVAFNKEHLLPKHVAAAAREAKGVFDAEFSGAVQGGMPMAPEKLVAAHAGALAAAEAAVRAVVVGEPDAEALVGKDALPALRTHAELARNKAEAANTAALAGVAEAKKRVYAEARAGFERDFAARVRALKEQGDGGVVTEAAYGQAFDAAVAAARRVLGEGLQGKGTAAGRKAELEEFLTAAAEACKREQWVLHQLASTEELLSASLAASTALVEGATALAFLSESNPTRSVAELREEFSRLRTDVRTELEGRTDPLAVPVVLKKACMAGVEGVQEAVWELLKRPFEARKQEVDRLKEEAAAVRGLEEEMARLKGEANRSIVVSTKAAEKVKQLEPRLDALVSERAGLEEEVVRLRAAVRRKEEREAEMSAALGRLEKRAAEAEALEKELEEARGKADAIAAKAAEEAVAAVAARGKKRKAEDEEEDEGGQEEGDGMEVASVKEEEDSAAAAPPAAKKGRKGAAASAASTKGGRAAAPAKGKSAKAAAASASAAAMSPGAQSKLDKAREAERQRIEESMTKRITRAGRGK